MRDPAYGVGNPTVKKTVNNMVEALKDAGYYTPLVDETILSIALLRAAQIKNRTLLDNRSSVDGDEIIKIGKGITTLTKDLMSIVDKANGLGLTNESTGNKDLKDLTEVVEDDGFDLY